MTWLWLGGNALMVFLGALVVVSAVRAVRRYRDWRCRWPRG